MISNKKLTPSLIGLHESLVTSSRYRGIKEAVVHLACMTKKGEVLLVSEGGVWVFPRKAVPMVGTLVSIPNEIIKNELGRDPNYMRGVNPTCTDTKLLGQYVDDDGLLHFVLRVNISHVLCKDWRYVRNSAELERIGEIDEAVQLAAAKLGLASILDEKVLQAA